MRPADFEGDAGCTQLMREGTMLKASRTCFIAVLLWASGCATAADTIKIGLIEPLSGPFAYQGNAGLHMFQMAIEDQNARGGVLGGTKLELVAFDNRSEEHTS